MNVNNKKEWSKQYYQKNREKLLLYSRIRLKKQKDLIYSHYGNICSCCGEQNLLFLSVDHINNDGYKDRQGGKGSMSGGILYDKIIKENFPDTYQILCYNCNCGKARNNGICPHELEPSEN